MAKSLLRYSEFPAYLRYLCSRFRMIQRKGDLRFIILSTFSFFAVYHFRSFQMDYFFWEQIK